MDKKLWIPFYKEFAEKLLNYRHNRKELLGLLYKNLDDTYIHYLHDKDNVPLDDVDPFTVLGIVNRSSDHKRIEAATIFKNIFGMKSEVPTDFTGIPVLMGMSSLFFGFKGDRKDDDIENLWVLFEKMMKSGFDIKDEYNKVVNQYGLKAKLTMGLYWIRPDLFLSLDSKNVTYLKKLFPNLKKVKMPFNEYTTLLDEVKGKMASGEIEPKNFYEFSKYTWEHSGEEPEPEPEPELKPKPDVPPMPADEKENKIVNLLRFKKNVIVQGAPGTGKTYSVPEMAVGLCCPDILQQGRSAIENAYKQLVLEGRVVFTTFHQSMDYEDFVEGLRPVLENGVVTYKIVNGVFKTLCENASKPVIKNGDYGISEDPTIWKVSLYSTYDNPLRTECMDNNHIRIGWDEYGPDVDESAGGNGKSVLNAFINNMQVGDIVLTCYTNRLIDAIGVVTSEYYWDNKFDEYKRVRDVKWLVKGIKEDIFELNNNTMMTLSTVYKLNNMDLMKVKQILDKNGITLSNTQIETNTKPYVLVIDEFNRGDVSKIFGELITLVEADKRLGEANEVKVALTYSKELFGVPSNLYIIGTMNTADRSLGNIDYAVRRRFAFCTMTPHCLNMDGFDKALFDKVSELFVGNYSEMEEKDAVTHCEPSEYLSEGFRPEDVWIGHSYFMMKDDKGNDMSYYRLTYEIVPMLKEYINDGIFKDEQHVKEVIKELEAEASKHLQA